MNAQELTLNIAVNLGRLCRWASIGNKARVEQFLIDTENYIELLDKASKKPEFASTYIGFKKQFNKLKNNVKLDDEWAENALTWANILTHRAKLA